LPVSTNELRRRSKLVKTLCAVCQERKARFRYRGEVRADRDHTLCFECYRGEVNRARARRLIDAAVTPQVRSPFGPSAGVSRPVLDLRQIAHRKRMLEHLQRLTTAAS
jgi:hypothetical protein